MTIWLAPLSSVAKRLRAMNTAAAEKPRLASCAGGQAAGVERVTSGDFQVSE